MKANQIHFSCVLLVVLFSAIFLSGCSSETVEIQESSEKSIYKPKTYDEAIAIKKEMMKTFDEAVTIKKETNQEPVEDIEEQPEPVVIDVQVEIQSKTSFSVGDDMGGSYVITNKGTPFQGVTIITYTAQESSEARITTRRVGTVDSSTGKFKALSLSDLGFISQTSTFESPGEFTYKIEIFTCEEVERTFGIECHDVDADEFKEAHNADPATSDVITVNVRD